MRRGAGVVGVLLTAAVVAFSAAACSSSDDKNTAAAGSAGSAGTAGSAGAAGSGGEAGSGGTGALAPEFPTGTGQTAEQSVAYPAGPYGVGIGSVVPNYQFVGFAGKRDTAVNPEPGFIQLADWYNPHADDPSYAPASPAEDDRLFPPGSPYGEGKAKPKGFIFDMSAWWCGPCRDETKNVIPGLRIKYNACGGDFFGAVVDGTNPGDTATIANLKSWVTANKTEFPVGLDPTGHTTALFKEGAYPANVLIDARTMTIVSKVHGVPPNSFYTKLENIIGYAAANKDADGNCIP